MAPVLLNPYRYGGAAVGAYATEVAADFPQLYWRMNDASGTVASDDSGNSNTGTYSGSPTLGTTGLLTSDTNKAITLTGANLVYRPGTSASVFTIEALIKPTGVSGTQVIASMQDAGASAWTFRLDGTDLRFYYWNASNVLQTPLIAAGAMAAATKHHVVATFTASGSAFVYIDGSQVATASVTTMHAASSSTLFRVGASGGGEFYSGVMDEVAYYTSALSAARVAVHAAAA